MFMLRMKVSLTFLEDSSKMARLEYKSIRSNSKVPIINGLLTNH